MTDTKDAAAAAPRKPRRAKADRRQDILKTLAELLQEPGVERITTAAIAGRLELSEAALYRVFASKAQMYEGLIDYIETTLVGLFEQIRTDANLNPIARIQVMVNVMLDFADVNPGLARVLAGQVFLGEDPRLMDRTAKLADKLEAHLRQRFREAMMEGQLPADFNASARANLIMNWVLGRWSRFAASNFTVRPNGVTPVAMEIFFK